MLTSWLVWGAWGALFIVLELLAVFWHGCPWRTLSTTAYDLVGRTGGWAAVAYVAGLAVLAVHLVAPKVFDPNRKNNK